MSNESNEQRQADTFQYVRLISQAQIETDKKLELVDDKIVQVGSYIVDNQSTLENIDNNNQKQTRALADYQESQDKVLAAAESLRDGVQNANDGSNDTNALLDSVMKQLQANRQLTADQQDTIMDALDHSDNEYTASMDDLRRLLNNTDTHLQSLDVHDSLKTIHEQIMAVQNVVESNKTQMQAHSESFDAAFGQTNNDLQAAIQEFNGLVDTTKQVDSKFDALFAQVNGMKLQLEAMAGATDDVESAKDVATQFNDLLNQQKQSSNSNVSQSSNPTQTSAPTNEAYTADDVNESNQSSVSNQSNSSVSQSTEATSNQPEASTNPTTSEESNSDNDSRKRFEEAVQANKERRLREAAANKDTNE